MSERVSNEEPVSEVEVPALLARVKHAENAMNEALAELRAFRENHDGTCEDAGTARAMTHAYREVVKERDAMVATAYATAAKRVQDEGDYWLAPGFPLRKSLAWQAFHDGPTGRPHPRGGPLQTLVLALTPVDARAALDAMLAAAREEGRRETVDRIAASRAEAVAQARVEGRALGIAEESARWECPAGLPLADVECPYCEGACGTHTTALLKALAAARAEGVAEERVAIKALALDHHDINAFLRVIYARDAKETP